MRVLILVLVGCCCFNGRAENACFRSTKEAALQSGVRDGEGFRLEGVRMDRVGGSRWARVVSCLHPEWPGVTVKVAGSREEAGDGTPSLAMKPSGARHAALAMAPPVVLAGAAVRVVRVEAMVRLEMAGVAQESGALGDLVRVRVGAAGAERLEDGVVRGDGLVALEVAR